MNFHGGADKEKGYRDFSVNIPPFELPESYKQLLYDCVDALMLYPEIDGKSAKKALAKHFEIDETSFLIGNGATELIYLMARAYRSKKVMVLEPTFTEYKRAFCSMQADVMDFPYDNNKVFSLNVKRLTEKLMENHIDILYLCNPNNPTGHFTDENVIEEILTHTRVTLIIDESFLDFVDEAYTKSYQKKILSWIHSDRVILMRSMTKNYCIPGVRIAYAIGGEKSIRELEKYKEPWSINTFALKSLPYLLDQKEHIDQLREWAKVERTYLYKALQAIQGIQVYEGTANYFLIHCENPDFLERLHQEGYHLRTCGDFPYLDQTYYRLTLRSHEENEGLIKAIQRVLEVDYE